MAIQLLPLLPPTDGPTRWRRLVEAINLLLKAVGSFVGGSNDNVKNFGAGYVAYGGLDNSLQGNIQFEFGTNLPNPSGVNGPALLLGSGWGPGGSPNAGAAWILTDQAYDNFTPGNFLGITAGETQGAGTANGGQLFLVGGGSFGGTGGVGQFQGGTSANARGGDAVLQGGSATGSTGAAVPGNAIVIGGVVGKVGANVLLIATLPPGATGPGDVRIQINSTILMQFLSNGEIYLTASGTGAGLDGQPIVSQGLGAPAKYYTGFTGSKVIGGQTYTWKSGLLDSVV